MANYTLVTSILIATEAFGRPSMETLNWESCYNVDVQSEFNRWYL